MGFFRRARRFFKRLSTAPDRNPVPMAIVSQVAAAAGVDPVKLAALLRSPAALRELLGHKNDAKDAIMAAGRMEEGVTLNRAQTNSFYRAFLAYDRLAHRG